MIITRYAAEQLVFIETVKGNPTGRNLVETLIYTESVNINLKTRSVVELLIPKEKFKLNKIVNKSLSETLTFIEKAKPRVYDHSCEEFLSLYETLDVDNEVLSSRETITFTENLTVTKSKGGTDTLTFTETLLLNKTGNNNLTETLTIVEGLSVYKPSKKYVSPSVANLVVSNNPIRFKFGSIEQEYRHYIFGNTENVNYSRINRKSTGGDLIVISANNYKVTTLTIELLLLKLNEIDQLQKFLHDTVGQMIEFRDHEAVIWEGIITTPNNPKSQSGRHTYSLSLEFQGERV